VGMRRAVVACGVLCAALLHLACAGRTHAGSPAAA
jgi:hypothetical protein